MSDSVRYPTLHGRVGLVTGAAGGIGQVICRSLQAQGVIVYAGDLAAPDFPAGGTIRPIKLDVTRSEDFAAALARIGAEGKGLDILVNNAGIYAPLAMAEETREGFRRIMDVNQFSVFWGMKAAAPMMNRGGAIVNLSSIGGMTGDKDSIGYTGTKWAVRGLTRSAANELAPRGIRVNCVCPGVIDTPMFYENDPAQIEALVGAVALGRLGQPEDIADAVTFLVSDQARYITGSDLVVDGGLLA